MNYEARLFVYDYCEHPGEEGAESLGMILELGLTFNSIGDNDVYSLHHI